VASGSENGNSTAYVNSRVNASDTLTLSSGNDTLLSGAQALGNRVVADVGNNLTITSLQDIDNYQSKQQSASGGFSVTFGKPSGSVGVSVSTSKINSEYASVGDQSGLFAGDGGYDIFTGNHTQLNGAVIASTADAASNTFSTGTLGWDSISNHAKYHASSISFGFSGSFDSTQKPGEQYTASALPALVNMSGSTSGTIRSAVADGTITVRDTQNQTQDVAELSRDTDSVNGHIDKIFDKEKVENQMAFARGVQELAGKVAGDVSAYKLDAAEKEASDRLLKEHPEYATLSQAALHDKVLADPAYKAVAADWGTGGTYSMVASAVAGALGGLSAGNIGAAASGAMAPYIANEIKQKTTTYYADGTKDVNVVANTMAHAVAGAVLAQLAGNSAAAGAAGAASGELIANAIVKSMYPNTDAKDLTESQKQTISALSQLAAGLAGGMASDSAQGAGTGAMAGKNAVENNALCSTVTCLSNPLDMSKPVMGGAGMAAAGAGAAAGAAIADALNGDKDGESTPNVGANLSDEEKAELGGSGSATPPPPENDPNQKNDKPAQDLNQKQESAIRKIDNTIKNALKDHDITGTLKDMDGNPVPKDSGGYWDHMQEMQNTLRGLRNHAETLKNVNNPEAQAAYGRATEAINKIESALKGHGI
jgi:filamentous hemagglutinin